MNYNDDVFVKQFPIVKEFVYHLTYYRELLKAYNDLQLKSDFWTSTIDAHILQATIHWSMVLGSDGSNPTHWKKLLKDESKGLEETFRQGLLKHIGMTSTQYEKYWQDMNDFRGKYAAHKELIYDNPTPDFTVALKVTYYYDKWIRELILPDIFEEPPLEQSANLLKKSVAPLLYQLLEYTKEVQKNTNLTHGFKKYKSYSNSLFALILYVMKKFIPHKRLTSFYK